MDFKRWNTKRAKTLPRLPSLSSRGAANEQLATDAGKRAEREASLNWQKEAEDRRDEEGCWKTYVIYRVGWKSLKNSNLKLVFYFIFYPLANRYPSLHTYVTRVKFWQVINSCLTDKKKNMFIFIFFCHLSRHFCRWATWQKELLTIWTTLLYWLLQMSADL